MSSQKTVHLARFKALDEGAGTFEAVVSVFGNVDLVGDRVVAGAFETSLKDWADSGDPIPVIWSHKWDDPHMHIGAVTEASEVADGLLVKGALDLDAPVAAQVYRLLKERRVKEFSFAYDVVREKRAPDGANELLELKVIEVGPTLKGANPTTQLLDVKAAPEAKAAQIKALVTLEGSYEQLLESLAAAVTAWAPGAFPSVDLYVAGLEATYPDHVVAYVEAWSDRYGGGAYYAVDWTRTGDGQIELGEPAPVTLTGVATPKALLAAAAKKADREAKAGPAPGSNGQGVVALVEALAASDDLDVDATTQRP